MVWRPFAPTTDRSMILATRGRSEGIDEKQPRVLPDRFRAAIPAPFSPPAAYRIIFPRRQNFSDFLDSTRFHALGPDQLERAIARMPLPIDESDGSIRSRAVAEYWRTHYAEARDVQLSFAMINRLVDLLLRENVRIRRALHLTYPAVFLDEFQDTTFGQFELLHTAFDGSGAVFTAVGDDKQRIIVWAGAMPTRSISFGATLGKTNKSCVELAFA
jgi:superfamily I DNA/RNA helicase